MQLQTDLRHQRGDGTQDLTGLGLGLGLGRAVRYCIVCVALEDDIGELPGAPY
jgi:hypothetical protein